MLRRSFLIIAGRVWSFNIVRCRKYDERWTNRNGQRRLQQRHGTTFKEFQWIWTNHKESTTIQFRRDSRWHHYIFQHFKSFVAPQSWYWRFCLSYVTKTKMDAGWPCNIVSSHCIYNYGIDLVLSEYQTNKHKQECHKLYFIYFF